MGGHQRFFHPNWFSRYIWGIIASVNLGGFLADQQYGVDRSKNPNIMWPWWHEIMRKKEKGEIPMDMPGYMPLGLDSPEQNLRSFQVVDLLFGGSGFWEEGSEYL
ncbi:unnamed protein product [Symbiodinium necroappetens]|uniref:Uncharacterized protein n=1 Tax=Symbiodinium necroappetens TaxID=1628268 RepID=A0A812S0F4_9DINO|nr:unnamed protein product [Symbiodinium necroappetens]